MLLEDNLQHFQACLASKTMALIAAANRGCLDKCELADTLLINNKFTAMLQFEPVGTVITAGYVSIATLDFTSFSSYGDLIASIVIDGVVIAAIPEGTYADADALLDAIALAINTNSTTYTSENVGSGILTISVVTAGASLNGTEVSVEINPTFFATEQILSGWAGNINVVNNPADAFYGKLLYGGIAGTSFTNYYIRMFDNGVESGMSPVYPPQSSFAVPPLGFPYALSTFITAYSNTDLRLLVTGATYGLITFMSQAFSFITNPLSPPSPNLYNFGIAGSLPNPYKEVVWNPDNNNFYVLHPPTSGLPNTVSFITSANVTGTATSAATGAVALTVNTDSTSGGYGDIWICGTQNIYVLTSAHVLAATIVGTAGHTPLSITFCAGTNRMYVVFRVTAAPATSYVRSFNATAYTVATATFYTINAGVNSSAVFYSSLFNVLFVNNLNGANLETLVLSMAGVLKDTIPVTAKDINIYYAEDLKNNKVWSISSNSAVISETSTILRYFEPGVEGEETIEAAFYGGVDPVLSEGDGNCITQAQVDSGIQDLLKECKECVPSGGAQVPVPSGPFFVIYYGSDLAEDADATDIEAMDSVTVSTYIGTYSFGATSPSEYRYISFPSLLGTPTRVYDPSTGFDVATATYYSVTINSVTYTVIQTYNALGGAIDISLT